MIKKTDDEKKVPVTACLGRRWRKHFQRNKEMVRWNILLRPDKNTLSSEGELGNIAVRWCDPFTNLVYICRYLSVSDEKWKQALFHSPYIYMKPLMWLSATSCWILCSCRTVLSTRKDSTSANHLQQPQDQNLFSTCRKFALRWCQERLGTNQDLQDWRKPSSSNCCQTLQPAKICVSLQNAAHNF